MVGTQDTEPADDAPAVAELIIAIPPGTKVLLAPQTTATFRHGLVLTTALGRS